MMKNKKNIISVSRRTDIPAFYSEWFMNRLKEGFCLVGNPFFPKKTTKVSLKSQDVLAFVFCTRNPRPLMKYLPVLDSMGYKYYFQYTLIGYPRQIDPHCPGLDDALNTFKELSRMIGSQKVVWRYDPIMLSNLTDEKWHIERLGLLMSELKDYTGRLVISFIDPYLKTVSRLRNETPASFKLHPDVYVPATYAKICDFVSKEAKSRGLEVQTCAEQTDLSMYGIYPGKCVDDALLGRIINEPLKIRKSPAQRKSCHCALAQDIGAYNTCVFGCKYCYATSDMDLANGNFRKHDANHPSMTQ